MGCFVRTFPKQSQLVTLTSTYYCYRNSFSVWTEVTNFLTRLYLVIFFIIFSYNNVKKRCNPQRCEIHNFWIKTVAFLLNIYLKYIWARHKIIIFRGFPQLQRGDSSTGLSNKSSNVHSMPCTIFSILTRCKFSFGLDLSQWKLVL